MATFTAPKSILKKTTQTAADARAEATRLKAERDRSVALHHAGIIQQRKETELEILLNTETLIDTPSSPSADPAKPSFEDADLFKKLVALFQPSDYDALIVERNINERCGYALCPRPRVKETTTAKYRLVGMRGRAKDFKVVPKEELERWCSEACARRAMYVKVQLNESPAWERQATANAIIELMDEPKRPENQLAEDLQKLAITNAEREQRNAADLALERGDRTSRVRGGLTDLDVKEKTVTQPAVAPSMEMDGLDDRLSTLHLSLEGHTSTFGDQPGQHRGQLDHLDEMDEDTDWKL